MVSSRRPRKKRTRGGVRDEGIAPARGTGTSKVLAVVALVSLAVFLQSRSVSDAIIGSRQYPSASALPGVSANASLPWRDRAQLRLLEARKPGSRAPLPPAGAGAAGETAAPPTGKLVFVKTYKTGSTTVASLLNAAGYQRGMSMLHPEKDGWFTEGEIVNRTAQGQMFDLGYRHLTPHVDYAALEGIVPGAQFATILRDPVARFMSLFRFVQTAATKYGTPQRLAEAVRDGKATAVEANSFCNNAAYLLSGRKESLARVPVDRAAAVARGIADELEARGVFVMITERLDESFVLLAERLGWDLEALNFQGVDEHARKSKAPRRGYRGREPQRRSPFVAFFSSLLYPLECLRYYAVGGTPPGDQNGGADAAAAPSSAKATSDPLGVDGCRSEACVTAVLECSAVDIELYLIFADRLAGLAQADASLARRVAAFQSSWKTRKGKGGWLPQQALKYPVTCRPDSFLEAAKDPAQIKFMGLHSCRGREGG